MTLSPRGMPSNNIDINHHQRRIYRCEIHLTQIFLPKNQIISWFLWSDIWFCQIFRFHFSRRFSWFFNSYLLEKYSMFLEIIKNVSIFILVFGTSRVIRHEDTLPSSRYMGGNYSDYFLFKKFKTSHICSKYVLSRKKSYMLEKIIS